MKRYGKGLLNKFFAINLIDALQNYFVVILSTPNNSARDFSMTLVLIFPMKLFLMLPMFFSLVLCLIRI